jgi:plasmid stabilization system protein ParE
MMRLPILILPQAKNDIGLSAQRFDNVRPGLSQAFIQQINTTLRHIQEFPQSCQKFRGDCRRAILHRFKHALVYRCLPDRIEIVGVMDDRRDPVRWMPRTGN